jgi:hypothetical protein
MPAAWSAKDERMYRAIKASCLKRDARRTRACPRIAAATVNKQRRKEERTLSDITWTPTGQLHNVYVFTSSPLINTLSIFTLIITAIAIAKKKRA